MYKKNLENRILCQTFHKDIGLTALYFLWLFMWQRFIQHFLIVFTNFPHEIFRFPRKKISISCQQISIPKLYFLQFLVTDQQQQQPRGLFIQWP